LGNKPEKGETAEKEAGRRKIREDGLLFNCLKNLTSFSIPKLFLIILGKKWRFSEDENKKSVSDFQVRRVSTHHY
jgi:hypothetical protein